MSFGFGEVAQQLDLIPSTRILSRKPVAPDPGTLTLFPPPCTRAAKVVQAGTTHIHKIICILFKIF